MKKTGAVACLVVCCCLTGLAWADETPPKPSAPAPAGKWGTVKTWFEHWKEGLKGSAVEKHYKRRRLSAVAAVRGAEQKLDDPGKPYIKGTASSKETKKLRKERAELAEAVELVLAGKVEEGSKRLDAFEAGHPNSPLLEDVRQAREMLKDMPEPERPPAAAPESKEGR